MAGINARLRLLVDREAPLERRFRYLEELSGVPASVWRSWWRRDATPGGELIEAACRAWPEFVLWLCTGRADSVVRQVEPLGSQPMILESLMRARDALASSSELESGQRAHSASTQGRIAALDREIARVEIERVR